MNNATQTVDGVVVRETAKALYVNVEGCHSSVWLPKSQMADLNVKEVVISEGPDSYTDRYFSAEIPAWLAARLPWNQTTAQVTRPW
jgi:hypothetical protein